MESDSLIPINAIIGRSQMPGLIENLVGDNENLAHVLGIFSLHIVVGSQRSY